MIIGHFIYDAEQNSYRGELRTLTLSHPNVSFLPQTKRSDAEPDYRVVEKGPHGTVEFGAAWRRQSDKGHSYLSVVLDDPAFAQGINFALFDDRAGKATLVWNRARAKAVEPAEQALPPEPKAARRRQAQAQPS